MLDCQLVLYYLRYYRMCNVITISIFHFLNITVIVNDGILWHPYSRPCVPNYSVVCCLFFSIYCYLLLPQTENNPIKCWCKLPATLSNYTARMPAYMPKQWDIPPVQPSVQFPALLLRTHPTSEPVGSSELYGWRIYCLYCCPSVRLSEYPVRADKIE